MFKRQLLLLFALILVGTALRFYNLNWGAPFYFHPDERNIASSISQLQFPSQPNPHFFAYGSLPLYAAFFLGLVINFFSSCHFTLTCSVNFDVAILITRFFSAFLSVLIIPLTFSTAERLKKGTGLLAAALSVFSTGYIQFAHFGTVEITLTFFSLLLFYCSLRLLASGKIIWSIWIGLIIGILISTKISMLVVFILPFFLVLLLPQPSLRQKLFRGVGQLGIIVVLAAAVFFLTNPYVLLDFSSFKNSLTYESSVGVGTLPVFYTSEFFSTIPGLFQLHAIYPFLLNPVVTVLFLVAFVGLLLKIRFDKKLFLLVIFFLVLFLSQALLFVKWTRYMVPTLPFVYLICSVFLAQFTVGKRWLIGVVVVSSVVFSVAYFITAFVEPDSRIQAVTFATKHITQTSTIMSEVYDLGIVPFNSTYSSINLFNTYELDNNNPDYTWDTLQSTLATTDYIILPSQRILKIRLAKPKRFPLGNRFYTQLTNGSLGFRQIYQTPCSIFCEIAYLGNPDYFEETATVFDRPIVRIYKKQ